MNISLFPLHRQLLLVTAFFLGSLIALAPLAQAVEDKHKISYQRLLDDERIEREFNESLRWQDGRFDKARVKIKVYNGYALLFGEVPEADLLNGAEQQVRKLNGVRRVFNQLTVEPAKKPGTIDDLLLSARIKTNLWTSINTDATRVRYQVDGSTVYLMGLLEAEEAQEATSLVKSIGTIKKVVTLFEYIE